MHRSLLCATVTASTMAELMAARDAACAADLVELRLDGVAGVDVEGALRGRRKPVVVTCRPVWEGGRFDGSEEERLGFLRRALELGADFIDVEWRAVRDGAVGDPGALVREHASRVVISSHEFGAWPADLEQRAKAMRATGAGTIKLAAAATRLSDTLALRPIARDGDAVVVGMGAAGVPTRLLPGRYRSRWTYGGNAVAPGQIPIARMLGEFRFRDVGPATRLFGVVSTAAMHSASPAMHNAAFAAAGIDAVYVPLAAADFDDFLEFAAAMGVEGASITIPFKRDALDAAEGDALADRVGAANTLRRRPLDGTCAGARCGPVERRDEESGASRSQAPGSSRWEAINTDVDGFLDPLERAFPGTLRDARAAVLGAGGAARAVVVALLSRGARVTVYARRAERARDMAAALGASAGGWPPDSDAWDLLVNCTPLGGGAARDQSPLPGGPFRGQLVYDLTYGPGESALLREAREARCRTLDGLPMLVAQAERQFEWWTGVRPPEGVMQAAAHAHITRGA